MNDEPLSNEEIEELRKEYAGFTNPNEKSSFKSDVMSLLATLDHLTKERDKLKAKVESLEEEKKLLPNEIALNKLRFLSAVLSMEFKIQEPHFIERVDTFILKTIAKLKEENENLRREDKNVMDECNRLAGVVEDLQGENEKLKVELDNQKKYVEEEVENLASEMNIQACDFDKELWRHLRVTLKRFGLDWDNYPDGIHADEAIEHIDQTYRMFQKEIIELKAKVDSLESELMEERSRNIVPYSFNGISEANEEITKLKKENEKLKEYKWMYEDLCK